MSNITKRALESSLKELLHKKSIDKITIQDLAEHCGISRATFYYHFRDIYELAEWCFEDQLSRALEGKRNYETWEEDMIQIFREVYNDRELVYHIYHSGNHERIERYLYQRTYQLLYEEVENLAAGMNVQAKDKRFIADFYKYSLVGLVLGWVADGMTEEPEEIVDRMSVLLRGTVEHALRVFENNNSGNTE